MMKLRTNSVVYLLAVGLMAVMLAPMNAAAGQITSDLEKRIESAGAEDVLHVIIRPQGGIVGSALKRQLGAQYATRAARHTAAVLTLQAAANAAQPPILNALNSGYFRDRVSDVESFWIDNVITARMTPSAIAEIADRPDVVQVALMPRIELVRPAAAPDKTAIPTPADAQDGMRNFVRAVKADSMWLAGYRGAGRLVASIDTGVEGAHILLGAQWRGNNGYSVRESYYEPMSGDLVPRTFGSDLTTRNHGTQVIGLMAASQEIEGQMFPDTLSICPDCQWITAAAVSIPCPGTSEQCGNIMGALQWVADPDGDPMTETDVPDAVANPWGIPQWDMSVSPPQRINVGCDDILFNAIDNIEAAGAAMFFAAGNEGDAPSWPTIRNPANRATSETNAFAVGMVDTRFDIDDPPVDALSSYGPSDCDGVSIKPDLMAPGVNLQTLRSANGIDPQFGGTGYGTSYATPIVAAGFALLRQHSPDATVEELKTVLLASAKDLGPTGPDNDYGHGLLDIMSALRMLPDNTQPSLAIKKDYYTRPAPGTTSDLILVLQAAGGVPATGISVTMFSEDPHVTILDGIASFDPVTGDADTTGNFDNAFRFSVAPDVIAGERYPVRFEITANGGYSRTAKAAVQIGPAQAQEVYTHMAGNIEMSVSSFGMFAMQTDALSARPGGQGFIYGDDLTQTLFEGAFLVGTDERHVSDNARDASSVPDVDFRNDPGGLLEISDPGTRHTQETRAAFSDFPAENSLGLFIEQRTWIDDDPDRDDYLVAEYTIHNRSGETIDGLRAGLFFDWDFPWTGQIASRDSGGYDPTEGLGYMYHGDGERYRGLAVINAMGTTSYRMYDNAEEIFFDFDGFSEADKWRGMSEGFLQTEPTWPGDGSQLIATGPFNGIDADSSITVAFAIIGGNSLEDLIASAQQARADYNAGEFNVTPGAMQFTAFVGGNDPADQQIRLTNGTEGDFDFMVESVPSWASVLPGGGTVEAGMSQTLDVSATVGILEEGSYTDDISIIVTDDQAAETEYPIAATLLVTSEPLFTVPVNPNPFNPNDGSATLSFDLPSSATVYARVYDLGGGEVKTLIEGDDLSAGPNSTTWNGKDTDGETVAEGVYLCHVSGGGFETVLKVVVKK